MCYQKACDMVKRVCDELNAEVGSMQKILNLGHCVTL